MSQKTQHESSKLKKVAHASIVLLFAGLVSACGNSGTATEAATGNDNGTNTDNAGGGDAAVGGDTSGGAGDSGGGTTTDGDSGTNGDGNTTGGGDDTTNGGDTGNTGDTTAVRTASLSLSAASDTSVIDSAGPWTSFDGEPSGITYSAATGELTIPEQSSGIHEFEGALVAGAEYTLAIQSENPNFAAVLYLINEFGQILPYTDTTTGATNEWIAARPANPLRFRAPLNVASYYIEIQDDFDLEDAESTLTNIDVANNSPTPSLPKTAAGDYLPAGFENLIFSDEFNGSSLDRSKWCTRLPYGGGPALPVADAECTPHIGQGTLDYANEEENQRFRDTNLLGEDLHVVSDGTIKLRATQTDLSREYQNFEAGALRSKFNLPPDPTVKYYVTARVKMPNVRGSWPAFYLNPDLDANGIGTTPPEIDILEGALNEVEDTKFSITQHGQINGAQTESGEPEFVYAAPGFNPTFGSWQSPVSLRARWIQVGIEWDPKGVCYYVEGYRTACENYKWVTQTGVTGSPATIIAYMAVGGTWAGRHGIDEAAFPIAFEMDYIRVFSKPYVAE